MDHIIVALKKKWAELNEEFQKKAHKRYFTEMQAKRQQDLDNEMKKIENYLLRLNFDLVYYLAN